MQSSENLWRLKKPFILASASVQRRALLEKARLFPSEIVSADIDESLKSKETPREYVRRISLEKARHVSALRPGVCVVAADTVLAVGRRIIRKARDESDAREKMKLLSGRRHRVITGLCVIAPDGREISKVVTSIVVLKKFDPIDIDILMASHEWENVAGYRIEGVLSAFVKQIIGSYTNIVGLPIYETSNILRSVLG